MIASKKSIASETESLFVRSLVKAALSFAPSADALRLEVARHMLDEQGLPDLAELFAAGEPRGKTRGSKVKGKAAPKPKRGRRTALVPSTPITVALAGVRRHGTFEANGISTLEQAAAYSESELTAIPGIGPGLLAALKDVLPRASLELRSEG